MEKNYRLISLKQGWFGLAIALCFCLVSFKPVIAANNYNASPYNFIQNKGQLKNTNGKEASEVLYYSERGNLRVFLQKDKISYVLNTQQKGAKARQQSPMPKFFDAVASNSVEMHRVDLTFMNANPFPEIYTEGPATDKLSFYNKGSKKGDEINHYSKIVYKNLYPNIDLVYHFGENDNFKYDFIVRPGGNPNDIAINYYGSSKLEINEDGALQINTTLGKIMEATPYTYLLKSKKEIPAKFNLNENQLTFLIEDYDANETLVIDPELAWSTYLGGQAVDNGFSITTDATGNVYIAGSTLSSAFPATAGAFQSALNGVLNTDIVISKFNKDGKLLWSTYYGGTQDDRAWGIAADAVGNIFVTGTTESSDFPTTAGSLQPSTLGISDGFILKFDTNGNRLYASFFGGEGNDYGYGVVTDVNGNVFITGYTSSVVGFPIVAASQAAPAAGDEVFISKLDNTCNLLWSTYFGGNSSDNGFSIAVDSVGNPYITGRTTSTNLPAALNASSSGDEIFIAKFNTSGFPLWSKYIGGSNNEVALGIAVDAFGAAYITGYTSSTDLPVTAGYFPATYGGGLFDAFVGKVDASGTTEWLSYYGGTGRDIGNEITIDARGKAIVVGLTESPNLVVSGDAYQLTKASQTDAFILRLTPDGGLDWGTYFGGSDDDYGYDIAYNKSKALYHIVGSTRSMNLPVKNAEQPNKSGGVDDIDIFIATFCGEIENNTIVFANNEDTIEICSGEAIQAIIGSVAAASGADFSYQYQVSLDGVTWANIASATGKDHTPTGLTQTTYFRRMVIYGGPCQDPSNTVLVIVNPLPVANFTASPLCSGDPVNFTNTSTGSIVSSNWNFGDGNTSTAASPSHTYSVSGSYVVELIVASDKGCIDTITKTIVVGAIPNAEFTAEAGCPGTSTVFQNVSTGAVVSWMWDYGDGSTSAAFDTSHIYASAGSYTVKLTATTAEGCSNTDSAQIVVSNGAVASFNYVAATSCFGDSTQFVSTSTVIGGTIASTEWMFGDGGTSLLPTPKHLYAAVGTYPVTLIATTDKGCKDTVTMNVIIDGEVVADFNTTGLCMNSTTMFSAAAVTGATYSWNFGDGSTGSGQSASNVYASAGSYDVTLIVSNAKGCEDSITKTIVIETAPDAEFASDVNSACPGTPISFTDNSTIATGTITSWSYNFGDGNTSTDQNPSHAFASAGNYLVTLTTSSSNGCSNTDSISITIFNAPAADFTAETCTDKVVQFTDASTVAGSTITGWTWNFGDGNSATSQNPLHTYASTGTYNVTLTVVSAQGCTATITKPVVVSSAPVADFTNTTPVCPGNEVSFTDNSSVSIGSIVSWSWNFGDGNTSSIQNPAHTYASAGTYNVTLTITTSTGCTKTVSKTVTVESSPVADFTATGNCGSFNTSFTDNSTAGSATITGWNWNFGDGSASTSQNPSHTYAGAGAYQVQLIVTSSNGCTDTIIKTITINTAPVADFTTSTVCAGAVTSFTDASSVSGGSITSWSWNFGDGGTSIAKNPVHTYATTGTFTISLTVVSNAGCSTTVSKTVTVNPSPKAGFTSQDGCAKTEISFTDNSQAGFGSITGWSWSFGDGKTSSVQNAVNNYSNSGIYTAQLVVTTAAGCTDTATGTVNIKALPVVNAGEDKTIVKGKSIQLNATSNIGGTFSWAPALGLSDLNIANPVAKPSDNITYVVTVTTADGCVGSDDVSIKVEKPLVIPTAFTPNNDGVNDEFEIQNLDVYPNAMVKVYNRWGSELFSSEDPNQRWDGKNRNEDMPMGAYYFVIDLKDGSEPIKGTISILK